MTIERESGVNLERLFIGIDPGMRGAIAFLDVEKNEVRVIDMPVLPTKEMDSVTIMHEISRYLKIYDTKEVFCVIEKAQPMSKQGVVSVFNYGKGYGELKAVLKIFSIPFVEIHPTKWKKYFALGRDKQASVDLASVLSPEIEYYGARGGLRHDRAEAVLLAWYGRNIKSEVD